MAGDHGGWEGCAVFRDTFSVWIEDAELRQRLLDFGAMLYDWVLEAACRQPTPSLESAVVRDLRAAADNLEFTQAFLDHLGRSASVSTLSESDEELSRFALLSTQRLSSLVQEIRTMLPPRGGAPP